MLAAVKQRLGVAVISADVREEGAAQRILADVRPEILVLNAGATPHMEPLDQVIWADFTATWETDVKAGLYWLQAALNLPLKPGSRVLVGSSGAAVNGSALSGGYAGAKHMLRFMARYANGIAKHKGLGIRSTRPPAPMRGRWAWSARRTWPGSVRRCRPANSVTMSSRCWMIPSTPPASPSA